MFFLLWRFQLTEFMASKVAIGSEQIVEQGSEPPRFFAIFNRDAASAIAAAAKAAEATEAAATTPMPAHPP